MTIVGIVLVTLVLVMMVIALVYLIAINVSGSSEVTREEYLEKLLACNGINLSEKAEKDVQAFLKENPEEKAQAIWLYRLISGASLRESKERVDKLMVNKGV